MEKVSICISIDKSLLEHLNNDRGNRSHIINTILHRHYKGADDDLKHIIREVINEIGYMPNKNNDDKDILDSMEQFM